MGSTEPLPGSGALASDRPIATDGSYFFRNRKVLVPGGSGLIGSAFIAELLPQGAEVRTVAHRRPVPFGTEVERVAGDLRSWDVCRRAVRGMDCVIHAAGVSGGSKKVTTDPFSMFADNLLMNTQILEAARLEGVQHYLFVSNTSVYSRSEQPLREEDAWGESLVGVPENETGTVKRAGEAQCALYARLSEMRIAIIRAANAYGPYDNFDLEVSHVIPALIRKAIERQNPLVLWGDGSAVRDFIHSTDVARSGLFVMELAKPHECNPVNIGTGRSVTVEEAARLILKIAEHPTSATRFEHLAPPASRSKRLDVGRMRRLGFEPRVSLEEGIQRTIEWYRSHAGEQNAG